MELVDDMKYTHELQSDVAIFKLDGNMLGTPENNLIKNDVIAYLDKGVNKFVIDLTELKHINSTGLGIFITLLTKIKSKNGELVLCNPNQAISNLLKITKLSSVFLILNSIEEAINHYKK
jgi:anti-sigma B factor antagonist